MIDKYTALPDAQKIIALRVLGAILVAPPLIRGATGYYGSDLVWMLPMLLAGAAVLFLASRLKDRATDG